MRPNLKSMLAAALCALAFAVSMPAAMAQNYVRGVLYHLSSAKYADRVLSYDAQSGTAVLEKADAAATRQHWTLSELSGSWRIINPFSMHLCANTLDSAVALFCFSDLLFY